MPASLCEHCPAVWTLWASFAVLGAFGTLAAKYKPWLLALLAVAWFHEVEQYLWFVIEGGVYPRIHMAAFLLPLAGVIGGGVLRRAGRAA